jgi:hypothetical protein
LLDFAGNIGARSAANDNEVGNMVHVIKSLEQARKVFLRKGNGYKNVKTYSQSYVHLTRVKVEVVEATSSNENDNCEV